MVGRWRQHCNDDDAVTRCWPGGARAGGCNCGDGGGELPDRPSPTPAPAATAAARPACVSRAVHTRAGRQPTRRPRSRTTPPASGPNAMLVSGSGRKSLKARRHLRYAAKRVEARAIRGAACRGAAGRRPSACPMSMGQTRCAVTCWWSRRGRLTPVTAGANTVRTGSSGCPEQTNEPGSARATHSRASSAS